MERVSPISREDCDNSRRYTVSEARITTEYTVSCVSPPPLLCLILYHPPMSDAGMRRASGM